MALIPNVGGHMHFSGSGTDDIQFGERELARTLSYLYLTTSGVVSISFDGGANFMTLADTTHVFPYPAVNQLYFQGGTWSGVGLAL